MGLLGSREQCHSCHSEAFKAHLEMKIIDTSDRSGTAIKAKRKWARNDTFITQFVKNNLRGLYFLGIKVSLTSHRILLFLTKFPLPRSWFMEVSLTGIFHLKRFLEKKKEKKGLIWERFFYVKVLSLLGVKAQYVYLQGSRAKVLFPIFFRGGDGAAFFPRGSNMAHVSLLPSLSKYQSVTSDTQPCV